MERIDCYLFQSGFAKSRSHARTLIENGHVLLDGKPVEKPSEQIDESKRHDIVILDDCPFVSRGGLKLQHALRSFGVSVLDLVCLDIGASTGGFTDCLLQYGARTVYAVDAGHAQLAKSLLEDSRVVSLENYNARFISAADFPGLFDLAVMDVSFISQTYILPGLVNVLKDGGLYIGLVKPQFEVGPEGIGKGGIVKDKSFRDLAVKKVSTAAEESGLSVLEIIESPVKGGDGNTEYLMFCKKKD